MPFPPETPYDILEIGLGASQAEIMVAYQRAIKQRRFLHNKITQAFHELRNPRLRIRHDLFELAGMGDTAQAETLLSELPPVGMLDEMLTPIPLTAEWVLPALELVVVDSAKILLKASPDSSPTNEFEWCDSFASPNHQLPAVAFPV